MEKERQVADDVAHVPSDRAMKVLIDDDSAIYRERLAAILARRKPCERLFQL
jgi:hypothetical protein